MKFPQKLLHQIILRIYFFPTKQICGVFWLSKLSKKHLSVSDAVAGDMAS